MSGLNVRFLKSILNIMTTILMVYVGTGEITKADLNLLAAFSLAFTASLLVYEAKWLDPGMTNKEVAAAIKAKAIKQFRVRLESWRDIGAATILSMSLIAPVAGMMIPSSASGTATLLRLGIALAGWSICMHSTRFLITTAVKNESKSSQR